MALRGPSTRQWLHGWHWALTDVHPIHVYWLTVGICRAREPEFDWAVVADELRETNAGTDAATKKRLARQARTERENAAVDKLRAMVEVTMHVAMARQAAHCASGGRGRTQRARV